MDIEFVPDVAQESFTGSRKNAGVALIVDTLFMIFPAGGSIE